MKYKIEEILVSFLNVSMNLLDDVIAGRHIGQSKKYNNIEFYECNQKSTMQ